MGIGRAFTVLFDPFVRLMCARNLRRDRFGTYAAILGVALGTATVDVVVALDENTVTVESGNWSTDPSIASLPNTVSLVGINQVDGTRIAPQSAKTATHEDYEVMRSAIRLGSLAAFLVGALIVFFTFGVLVDRRRREVALLRSLGALPGQVAAIFVREAVIIGVAGAVLGFVGSVPLAFLGAAAGITTTGRDRIYPWQMDYPWKWMALFAFVGAATALLGVLRPARDVFRLKVADALRPRFLEGEGARAVMRQTKGITLIALPFAALVYALMRPFFQRALPSLTFFVFEASLVCASFLATLFLVPELVRRLGGLAVRILPSGNSAERLLTQRRIERMGHELSWSVSGVMLVFSLLLALHIATRALKQEVTIWARDALHDELFVTSIHEGARADGALTNMQGNVVVRYSGRTSWPNVVQAASPSELAALAEANGDANAAAVARRLAPGKILLSRLMARRLRVSVGDGLDVAGRGGTRRFEVVGVTDALGFVPQQMPYRNAKTYATIDPADYDVIAPYADTLGTTVAIAHGGSPSGKALVDEFRAAGSGKTESLMMYRAQSYRRTRIGETDKDFRIFDLMLALTSILAAIGIANQLVLSVRARRRELALYRVLGMSGPQVRGLVILEGGFIGFLGGVLATLLGVPLGYAAVGILKSVSVFEVEFELPPHFVVLTILGSIVVAGIASLYPAGEAKRADAAESVHYE